MTNGQRSAESGPLSGLRVLDLSGMISGSFATLLLADFGADVIFVEHPEYSDPIREWPPTEDSVSLYWKALGRNKRCITLDLSTDHGRDITLQLVEDSDVVIENFRPKTLERWGLGYEDLQKANREIILTRLSGYGQTGPQSKKPGFGTVAEGYSSWPYTNGFPESKPLLPPISIADLTAAQFAVFSTMFAVYERDIGGDGDTDKEGQVIDVSLYEPLFRLFVGDVEQYDKQGIVHERTGNRHQSTAPRNIYETADGYITLSASSQRIFENVAHTIGRSDIVEDPRFKTNEERVKNVDALDDIIESWTQERSRDTVIETMEMNDAIVGPVYNIEDIFDDEQYMARDNIVEIEDDDVGIVKTHGIIPKFSRTPGTVDHAGPRHGEHNREIFTEELGLSEAEYEQLQETGVIKNENL